jgi:hypothetical protein
MPSIGRKVILIQLLLDTLLETDGTTSFTFTDTDAKQLEHLGLEIESIRALVVLKNKSTNFAVAVHLAGSILGRSWSTPAAIQTDVTANGETVGSDFTTSTAFCFPNLKALVGVKNTSGGARETGSVSAWLVVTLKT